VFCRTVDEAGLDDYASTKLDWTIAGDRSVMLNRYSDASNNYYYKFNVWWHYIVAILLNYSWHVPLPTWYRPDDLKRQDYKMEWGPAKYYCEWSDIISSLESITSISTTSIYLIWLICLGWRAFRSNLLPYVLILKCHCLGVSCVIIFGSLLAVLYVDSSLFCFVLFNLDLV
jgi:hypothetical protein